MAADDLTAAMASFKAIIVSQQPNPPAWATAAVGWLLAGGERCDSASAEQLQKAQRVRTDLVVCFVGGRITSS
jgi:hypothetical protein